MGESSTIGAMVSTVLGEAVRASQATRDVYQALTQKLSCRVASDVCALERNPTSAARRAVIAEAVDQLPELERTSLKALATKLAEALRASGAEGPIGIEVRRLDSERTKREVIDTHESTAARKVHVRELREA